MTRHLRPGLLGEDDKSSVIQCRKTPGYSAENNPAIFIRVFSEEATWGEKE